MRHGRPAENHCSNASRFFPIKIHEINKRNIFSKPVIVEFKQSTFSQAKRPTAVTFCVKSKRNLNSMLQCYKTILVLAAEVNQS